MDVAGCLCLLIGGAGYVRSLGFGLMIRGRMYVNQSCSHYIPEMPLSDEKQQESFYIPLTLNPESELPIQERQQRVYLMRATALKGCLLRNPMRDSQIFNIEVIARLYSMELQESFSLFLAHRDHIRGDCVLLQPHIDYISLSFA